MGDLPLAPRRAHRHFTDGRLRRGQSERAVVVHATACGIGLVAQRHTVGLVRCRPGTQQRLPIGGTDGTVTDHHRMTQTRIVVGSRHTAGVVRVIDAIAGKHLIGILHRQAMLCIGADHHFLGAVGKGAVTDQYLIVLRGVDAPAIHLHQPKYIGALGRPGRRLVRQQQAQQAVGITVVDVVDVAVGGDPAQQGHVRVAPRRQSTDTVQQLPDRAEIDHGQAQHRYRGIALRDVGAVDGQAAVLHITIAAEHRRQGGRKHTANRADHTAIANNQAAACGRRWWHRRSWRGRRRGTGHLPHNIGQAIRHTTQHAAHGTGEPTHPGCRTGQAAEGAAQRAERGIAGTVDGTEQILHRPNHIAAREASTGLLQAIGQGIDRCAKATAQCAGPGHAGDQLSYSLAQLVHCRGGIVHHAVHQVADAGLGHYATHRIRDCTDHARDRTRQRIVTLRVLGERAPQCRRGLIHSRTDNAHGIAHRPAQRG